MKHPAKKQRYDYTLLVVVLLLVGIGLILLYSTSAYNGRVKFHDSFYYLKKQGFATAIVKEIIRYASDASIKRLWLSSSVCGKRIYEQCGFVEKGNEMECFL